MQSLVEDLKRFKVLRDLTQQQLELLAEQAVVSEVRPKQRIIARGSSDQVAYYLLDGTLTLTAEDGRVSHISSDQPSARVPISQLIPRRYEVTAKSAVRYLSIDLTLLATLTHGEMGSRQSSGYEVSGDGDYTDSDFEQQLIQSFLKDLEQEKLILPSLPDVAVKISRAIREETSDAHKIAELIQTDPVISAKMIKAANSAMYAGRSPAETCAAAVVRLGTDVTHNLVMAYAVSELFNTRSNLLKKMMQELWVHSRKVAALCYVLARHDRRFNPEEAMLVGLLHDIGIVAVLNYAQRFPDAIKQRSVLTQACDRLRAETGSLILRSWGFSNEFIVATLEAESWMRDTGSEPDYCDLLLIAQLHSYLGTDRAMSTPAINEIPAHTKLALGELTPEMSLMIIEESRDQLVHAEALLSF